MMRCRKPLGWFPAVMWGYYSIRTCSQTPFAHDCCDNRWLQQAHPRLLGPLSNYGSYFRAVATAASSCTSPAAPALPAGSKGLTSAQVKELQAKHGRNQLTPPKEQPEIIKFLLLLQGV